MNRVTKGVAIASIAAMALAAGSASAVPARHAATRDASPARRCGGRLPIAFEENRGQTDARVRFLARCREMTAFFAEDETVFALRASADASVRDVVRMRFVGASATPTFVAGRTLPGKSNYFIGNDAAKWVVGVPQHDGVVERGVRRGTDVRWRTGDDGRLEYDVVLAAGADLGGVAFDLVGAKSIVVGDDGALRVATEHGEMRHSRPVAYQTIDGARRDVAASFVARGDGRIGFEVGRYDAERPLVVDPSVVYSTFLGGSKDDVNSFPCDAVDAAGAVYVAGVTQSADFPLQFPFQASLAGASDFFVVKINAAGTATAYSTYVGGSNSEGPVGCGIAVDASGAAYVTSRTASTNFPTVSAVQATNRGGNDAVVFKLAATGAALVYSTYLGGSGDDLGRAIAVDSNGTAYVGGETSSPNFPVASPLQGSLGAGAGLNGFVAKIAAAGGPLIYSTYLGGSVYGIAADSSGAAYVAGWTNYTNFPTTQSAVQRTYGGGSADAFVAKINPSGSGLAYSTFLGGTDGDVALGIAVDSSGAAYVAGATGSLDFPTSYPYQANPGGGSDAFAAKLNPSGSFLVYSTFLGGAGIDIGYAVAVDPQGAAVVVGYTTSTNYPTVSAPQAAYGGSGQQDGFVTKLDSTGFPLVFSTYLGGPGNDIATGVAIDASGSTYVVGYTNSSSFPVVSALQSSFGGLYDAFVVKYDAASGGGGPPPNPPTNLAATYQQGGGVSLSWNDNSLNETGFRIERMPEGHSFSVRSTTGPGATSWTDYVINPSTTYSYRVAAFNGAGLSAYSNVATITTAASVPIPPAPDAPSGFTATPVPGGSIVLAWTDNSFDEVVFDLQRSVGGAEFGTIENVKNDVTAAIDADVHPGWSYAYRIRALAIQGPSEWSKTAVATIDGTIGVTVLKGGITDSPKRKRDKLRLTATYAPLSGAALDPVANGLELRLGPADAPVVLSIAPKDGSWKVKRTRATKTKPSVATSATWKSAKGASPAATIHVGFVHRTLTATVTNFDFAAAPTPDVHVLLASGADGGGEATTWTGGRGGAWRYKAPK